MEQLFLEKPDLSRVNESETLKKYTKNTFRYFKYVQKVCEPAYLYWDKLKYKEKPDDLSAEEFWYLTRQIRKLSSRPTFLRSENGEPFTIMQLDSMNQVLHKIDLHTGMTIVSSLDGYIGDHKQKLITRGILEEAIASSQLEGAHTTRNRAKQLILENRAPKSESEQMILNNYRTMQLLDENYKDRDLTLGLLYEMHASLTKDTVPPDHQFRLRLDSDEVLIRNNEYVAHIPPRDQFLKQELDRLIVYANDLEDLYFIHPVVKAIFLHFWIGYLHPFTDGNGRLARTVFYWYLLRKGYWSFMFLPISSVIKNSPVQYAKAFIYTEQDENDLTYFYDYIIHKIMRSIEEFEAYVVKVRLENKQIDNVLGGEVKLNERQKQLIHYLLGAKLSGSVTITSHMTLNAITRLTADHDLKYLVRCGFLESERDGKYIKYKATKKLLLLMN